MFQTNPPNFDSIPEDPALAPEEHGQAEGSAKADTEYCSPREPEFATLEAFAAWLDHQLEDLEANHEGFETASSVRGFYGR
jgi:hypothetical protein